MVNPIMAVATVGVLALLAVFLLPAAGMTVTIGVAIMLAIATVLIGKQFGYFKSVNPIPNPYSILIGLVIIVFAFGISLSSLTSGLAGGITAQVTQPQTITQQTTQLASDACIQAAKAVNPDNVGKAATVTLNAYDQSTDNPYSAAVDTTVYVFRSKTAAEANNANYVFTGTDTSAASVTGVNVGDTVTIVGGNVTYYMDALQGHCVTSVNDNVNLNVWAIPAESSLLTVVYTDTTGSTAMTTGSSGTDYTEALGASQIKAHALKLTNNVANRAYQLGGYGFAVLTNISSITVNDPAFSLTTTPNYLSNVAIGANNSAQNTITRSYSVYKLNTPMVLTEFAEKKIPFTVTVSSNEPVACHGCSVESGYAGVALDTSWTRGSDGKAYQDIHDHSLAGGVDGNNVGMSETVASPNGLDSGFLVSTS